MPFLNQELKKIDFPLITIFLLFQIILSGTLSTSAVVMEFKSCKYATNVW